MSFGGGGGGSKQATREMGKAAMKQAEVAERALDFSMEFFREYMAPMLETMTETTAANEARMAQLFDLQFSQAQLQDERYRQYGIPAEDRFYRMADEYSADEYAERQAALALGDVRAAQQSQTQQLNRQLAARGIDPTSPAAVAAMTDAAVMNSVAQASAVNRARNMARDLGMAITADAANFGRGALAGGLNYGQAARGTAGQSVAGAQGQVAAGSGAAGVPMQGFQTASSAYGSVMRGWADLAELQARQEAANASGFGKFLGTVIGAGLSFSDRRLKKDIVLVGQLPNGLNVYEFEFIWGGGRRYGVMADEVEKVMPEAVTERLGFKMVDYDKLRAV